MKTEYLEIAVAGLHLTGQPLNHQLITLGGELVKTCRTAEHYKMFLIEDEKGLSQGPLAYQRTNLVELMRLRCGHFLLRMSVSSFRSFHLPLAWGRSRWKTPQQ